MLESSGAKYNKYKHQQATRCWCAANCVLTIAYAIEALKGLKTPMFAALFILVDWLPCLVYIIIRKSNKVSDDGLEYVAGIGYLAFYVFVMLTTSNQIVFCYIFPILCILTVYCNRRLNNIVLSTTVIINIISIADKIVKAKGVSMPDLTAYEVQIACVALCNVFLWRSSKVLLLRDHMIAQLADEAYFDALTGLRNRAYLELLEKDFESEGRYIAGIAMLDIDRFKQINDEYGHKSGDTALRFIATRLKIACKSCTEAIPIRIGGDEFVIISAAKDMAKLESACEKAVDDICDGSVRAEDGREIKITASIGIIRGARGKTFSDLYSEVDKALYKAKSEGRNRVVTVGKNW